MCVCVCVQEVAENNAAVDKAMQVVEPALHSSFMAAWCVLRQQQPDVRLLDVSGRQNNCQLMAGYAAMSMSLSSEDATQWLRCGTCR
jgi:hypothetical protein